MARAKQLEALQQSLESSLYAYLNAAYWKNIPQSVYDFTIGSNLAVWYGGVMRVIPRVQNASLILEKQHAHSA